MVILRNKEIKKMTSVEAEKKLKELKLELVKSRGNSSKSANTKIKEIKKTIAKILTINKPKEGVEKLAEKGKLKKQ